ncbi:MAG: hypothetical protein WDA06_00970 [Phenylobacterium sp.]
MKVFIDKQNAVTLTNKNFLSSGGEASIYVNRDQAFKIYSDPKKAIALDKIKELQQISSKNIVCPQSMLYDDNGKLIGYTMKFVSDTVPLCKVFTKSYKNRHAITTKEIINLVNAFRNDVEHVHSKDILIVDLNELNFLLNKDNDTIYFIDVDSYQTKSFPATAIMESIRDRHSKTFSKLTDWFSWGIITFQMYVGIHPYKGRHSSIKDMNGRMLQNISVFNKDVSIPSICNPISSIPENYRNWYKAIFENGKRLPPPTDLVATVYIKSYADLAVDDSGQLIFEELETYDDLILKYAYANNNKLIITTNDMFVNRRKIPFYQRNVELATTATNASLLAWVENQRLKLYNVATANEITVNIASEQISALNGRIYSKFGDTLSMLEIIEIGSSVHATLKPVTNILEKASFMFNSGVLQNLLGAWYANICCANKSYQVRLKELDGIKLIDAKYNNHALLVLGNVNGQYKSFLFRFSKDFSRHTVIVKEDAQIDFRFACTDMGILALIEEDGCLKLLSNKPDEDNIKSLSDKRINYDMQLAVEDNRLIGIQANKLYRIFIKKAPLL